DGVAATVVERARVGRHAPIRTAGRARHPDRTAAGTAATDARERIARSGTGRPDVPAAIGGQLLHGEPGRVVDDAPLRDFARDDFSRRPATTTRFPPRRTRR